jgi:ABC-2 type transport system ATP-binding protein/lipopolysaccharide transport system ATP-binding protein
MASVSLEQVTVEFPIYNACARSLKGELFRRTVGGKIQANSDSRVSVQALCGVNLRLSDSDRLGLLGHNGAGKSTLLRVIAGIYEPPIGRVRIDGTVASLTDIMMGMDLECTGYDNIILRGVFLGMKVKDIQKRVPEIEEFTELGEFLKLPLRTYSSGMMLRLAFAVTTTVTPEILIMDEMIGAGDAAFVSKAQVRLDRMISNSPILVLASHSADLIRRFCNTAAMMQGGRIVRLGPVEEVIAAYLGDKPAQANLVASA